MIATLDQLSGMPKMRAAFQGWFSRVTLRTITQTIIDGLVTETYKDVTFQGTVQPLTQEELRLKPEGERSWQWLQIHCIAGGLNLQTNDKIVYSGVNYKIMAVKDYSLNNYIEYHAVRDYENE